MGVLHVSGLSTAVSYQGGWTMQPGSSYPPGLMLFQRDGISLNHHRLLALHWNPGWMQLSPPVGAPGLFCVAGAKYAAVLNPLGVLTCWAQKCLFAANKRSSSLFPDIWILPLLALRFYLSQLLAILIRIPAIVVVFAILSFLDVCGVTCICYGYGLCVTSARLNHL